MNKGWLTTGLLCVYLLASPVRADEASPELARQLYTRAATALASKDIPLAASELAKLVEQYPDDSLAPLAALRLAECHLSQGDSAAALEVLDAWIPKLTSSATALALEPTAALRAQLVLAHASFMADKLDAVVEIAREQADINRELSVRSAPEKALLEQIAALGEQASKRRAQAQAQSLRDAAEQVRGKRYGEALKTLAKCRPDQLATAWLWRYHLLHAQALLGRGQPAAALDELDGIALEPLSSSERAAVHMARLDGAMALQQLARAQAEIDTLTASVEGDSFLGPTVALRAVELATLRKDREAAQRLAAAAKQAYPKFASAHEFDLLLARNALASIQFDEARRILTALLAAPPKHDPTAVPRANWLLGESYFLAQDYRQAIAAYTTAIDSDAAPAWTEISLMQRAKCYELLGELTAATADYERVAEGSKRSSFTMTAHARLNQIDNYLRSASAASKSKLK